MRTKERWYFDDKNGDGGGTTDFFVLWILGARGFMGERKPKGRR